MLFRGESVGDCNSELGDEISITVCVWDCDLGERRCLCLFSSQFNFECVLYDCDQWVQCLQRVECLQRVQCLQWSQRSQRVQWDRWD